MRAKAIVEHAGDAIFTVDKTGTLRQVNAVGARLLGYDAVEAVGYADPAATYGAISSRAKTRCTRSTATTSRSR